MGSIYGSYVALATIYCGVPDPPCLSKMPFVLADMLGIVV